MKISHLQLKLLCNITAAGFFLAFIYRWHYNISEPTNMLAIAAAFGLMSYRFSLRFKMNNSLKSLVERRESDLVISRLKISPFSKKSSLTKISVARISLITAADNYLSIIIDGNGNGYDFQLLANKDEIVEHIQSLLSCEELAGIKISNVN
ncbi:hypothetical protein KO495_08700 [Colwellia sp. D2M02]|uniref:hypothetical protein n=1 Tax=Colwellia sp. D2M02 TaxID=2841562 RepID=UPI001C0A1F71|nr:hypothetical protein [Colwellia sp. D2M02]MBU2893407.1 hypothetical protein [Colwellia sp. D2M02]